MPKRPRSKSSSSAGSVQSESSDKSVAEARSAASDDEAVRETSEAPAATEDESQPKRQETRNERRRRRVAERAALLGGAPVGDAADEPKDSAPAEPPAKRTKLAEDAESGGVFTAYIEGLPFEETLANVEAAIKRVCPFYVSVRAPTWHDSARLKGYAHVDFASAADRDSGIERLDRLPFGSRYLTATVANTKSASAAVPARPSTKTPTKRLFIKNLPYEADEVGVRATFSFHGKVDSVRVVRQSATGKSKGIAYVDFEKLSSAQACVAMAAKGNVTMNSRVLFVDFEEGDPKAGFKDALGRSWSKTQPKSKDAKAQPWNKNRGNDKDRGHSTSRSRRG